MQKKSNRKVIIQTIPLRIPYERVTKFIKDNDTLEQVITRYVEELEDVEIFHKENNCIVTNKGYHFADDYAYNNNDI